MERNLTWLSVGDHHPMRIWITASLVGVHINLDQTGASSASIKVDLFTDLDRSAAAHSHTYFISKSAKVSANFASTRQPTQTRKSHAHVRKNGLRDGSMARPKHPTTETWEGGPTHPIPCNPRDVS